MLKHYPHYIYIFFFLHTLHMSSLKQKYKSTKMWTNKLKLKRKIMGWAWSPSGDGALECNLLSTVKKTVTKCYFWILILLCFLWCSVNIFSLSVAEWGVGGCVCMHMLTGCHRMSLLRRDIIEIRSSYITSIFHKKNSKNMLIWFVLLPELAAS